MLQATGTGSRLSLPALTKVTEDTSAYDSLTQVQAVSGGDVELPKLTTISGGPVQLESDGSGSTLNINVLTSIEGNAGQQYYSGLQATNDGTVSDAALVTINKANLTLDGTGTLSINQIETFTVGTLSLSAGTETYTGLSRCRWLQPGSDRGRQLELSVAGELCGRRQVHVDSRGLGKRQQIVISEASRRSRRTRRTTALAFRSRPSPEVRSRCRS